MSLRSVLSIGSRRSGRSEGSQGHSHGPQPQLDISVPSVNQNNAIELQSYVVNKIEMLRRRGSGLRRVSQLAAFVPDFVLREEIAKVPSFSTCEAVVYVADISGFTALSEAYSMKGNGGTDQLSKTLSNYMGPLVECILWAGGDIIKYAGDAFLAIWKVHDVERYPELVAKVADCAIYQQTHHGAYHTELNITIRVKIGIGAGPVHCALLGNAEYQHWVCFGPGVDAASAAEKSCSSNEVFLHNSAWEHGRGAMSRLSHEKKPNQFVRVFEPPKEAMARSGTGSSRTISGKSSSQQLVHASSSIKFKPPERISIRNDQKFLRTAISYACEKRTEGQLRHFINLPVLKKMDDEIPIEYLNESRLVSIVFIHMDIGPLEQTNYGKTMSEIVQRAFRHIQRSASILQGCINKIIMFDKGLTFLVVFGLPGFGTDGQSSNALKCAFRLKSLLMQIKHVRDISIGVATGPTYCGVLGHQKRHEYTVIGRKVNKAARLMMNYPSKLTCDQDTMYHSKLPTHYFNQLESRTLKGIANVGKIFEFLNVEGGEDHTVKSFEYPMLGREAELKFFRDTIDSAKLEYIQRVVGGDSRGQRTDLKEKETLPADLRKLRENPPTLGASMLVYEGESGIGKSRLLGACIEEASRTKVRVFSVGMNILFAAQRNFAVKSLLIQALGLENLRTAQEKEEALRKAATDPELELELAPNLCLLNEILGLKLPTHQRHLTTDIKTRASHAHHVAAALLRQAHPGAGLLLLVVDDAHLMDEPSWEFIQFLSRTPRIFLLLSLRRSNSGSPRIPDFADRLLYHSRNVKTVRMTGLHSNFSAPLACQLLEVRAIPIDLERILGAKGKGVPAWYAQVLAEFVRTGILLVIPFNQALVSRNRMRVVDDQSITRLSHVGRKAIRGHEWHDAISENIKNSRLNIVHSNLSQRQALARARIEESRAKQVDPKIRMCVVGPETDLKTTPLLGSLREILQDTFDELNSSEQLILKCGSVLGLRFSRLMLARVLPLYEVNSRKYEAGFRHLFEQKLLHCASTRRIVGALTKDEADSLQCHCNFTQEELKVVGRGQGQGSIDDEAGLAEGATELPKYYKCKYIEFSKESMLEVVYDLMIEDLRREFHLKAAKYLDSSSIRCSSCSGQDVSVIFGVPTRTQEFSTAENEDAALRLKNLSKKRGGKENVDEDLKHRKHGKSVHARLDQLRRSLGGSSTRLTLIELDIFKALEDFGRRERESRKSALARKFLKYWATCGIIRKKKHEGNDDGLGEVDEFEEAVKRREVAEEEGIISEGSQGELLDMRSCECAAVQARVALELVRHYRSSDKYGKCLVYLLEAAETSITIGNGTQALVHLEDALGLIQAIESNKLPKPVESDLDDIIVDKVEVEVQMEFLNGLAYFELGIFHRAREYFLKSVLKLGIDIPTDEVGFHRDKAIRDISMKLWRSHHQHGKRKVYKRNRKKLESWTMKYRILSYLHLLYKIDQNLEMALLMALWQAHVAEDFGNFIEDIIPAYCNIMEVYSLMGSHRRAGDYERRALELIRENYGRREQMETFGLLATSNLFISIAQIRLKRGEVNGCVSSGFLALRLSGALHDNTLSLHVFPTLFYALLLSLRLQELVQLLQRLWYTAEEEQDWSGSAAYYTLCLDLLLNTAFPIEPFHNCEAFANRNDWAADLLMFREYEIQYNMESGLALWFARHSKWEPSHKWARQAETHRPRNVTHLSVCGDLKLLEVDLILIQHHLAQQRYQHFAIVKVRAKGLMRIIRKAIPIVPIHGPRFEHLLAYYCRVRGRISDSDLHIRKANKLANKFGSQLELAWLQHSQAVWGSLAVTAIREFWVEHTTGEDSPLDWHSSGKIPWTNVMYSLPIPDINTI